MFFHEVRHPAEMGEPEINAFLAHLAVKHNVGASTQNQALSALLFLYRYVIGREVCDLGAVIRVRKPRRLPVVLTRDEVRTILGGLGGCRTIHAPNANSAVWPIFQLLFGP
ncbi:MAG: phage integrase N-terminal SAM-like domain-containing protein [Syntrophotalea sp.]|uniref:phage integrase N-terminal SAM-like domain-containing protein n=1 Tax=Syntrophotalea sp. TaxID=2812029 RepID=UPI003D0BB642